MKKYTVALSGLVACCLLFSGLPAAAFGGPEPAEIVRQSQPMAVPEPITTNVLLRQILAEMIKANSLKADNRCSDGEKQYSPGYIISVDKKTLRCDASNDYPEWVAEGKE